MFNETPPLDTSQTTMQPCNFNHAIFARLQKSYASNRSEISKQTPQFRGLRDTFDIYDAALTVTVSAKAPSAGVLRRPVGLTYPLKNHHFSSVAAQRRSQPSGHFYDMIYGISVSGYGTLRRIDHTYRCQYSCIKTLRKAL